MDRGFPTGGGFLVVATLALHLLQPHPATAENRRHHVGVTFGYQNNVGSESSFYEDAGVGALSYRFSLRRMLDVTLDTREAVNEDGNRYVLYYGPGIRVISPSGGLRPYAQVNLWAVDAQTRDDQGDYTFVSGYPGVGYAFSAGFEIGISNLVSIPIEASYTHARSDLDLSSVGGTLGITFNFGALP